MVGRSAASSAQAIRVGVPLEFEVGGPVVVEVVVGPVQERVDPAVRAAEQDRVQAEPGGEGDRSLDLVAVRADLGDRGVAADHRHDALVVVVERRGRLAVDRRAECSRGPFPGLLGDRSELRQRAPVRRRDVGDVADGEDAGEPGHRQVGGDVDPAAAARRGAGAGGDRGGRLAAAPDHRAGGQFGAVGQLHGVRVDLGDGHAEGDL